MTDQSIAVRNVYVMLAYAFRAVRSDGADRILAERFEHLQDLLAEMLIQGVGAQVKRGLHRGYLEHRDELATVRGRINVSRTMAEHTLTRGRLVCEFDEYELDTPHNRALKSVIVLLLRHGDVAAKRKDGLRRLLPYLDAVALVSPLSIRWNELSYHRANANYRLLLGVSEMIVKGLLPTHDAGTTKLTSWVSDDQMSKLYERFILEYFRFHHPELDPAAPMVAWHYAEASASGTHQLPAMYTDVTLRRGNARLIIDAKFYRQSMQTGAWNKATVRSAHLYQLLAYVKNADRAGDGSVSGVLLYARAGSDEQPDLDIVMQGNRIGARTLDLNEPWERLRTQLEDVATWLNA